MTPPVLVDAHQHFWRLARGDYGWLTPDLAALYRDFGADDLAPLLDRHGIARTILVQAAPTVAETRFLLDEAARTRFVAGVVGWADFAAPDAADVIAGLAADPLLVGLRPMVQDIADDDWLLRPDLAPALDACVAHGLVFDALVLPRHLPRLLVFLARHPELTVVLDHGAKPTIRDGRLDPWRADMAAVAARPNTWCKLSGLATEAGPDWTVAALRPYVDHLLAVFGPERLLWGSDWPVVNLAGGYDRWREAALALVAPLGASERAAILGGNAARVYLHSRGRLTC
ncbi:amidohydrolase family protein [Chelatococcus sp. SYSU_G07232]|uniref:Amidohydrolase family protein n=1 Tax=Chelatococcus albus TaxID=3047466 RepID=A0ABT7ADN3_9HYPH|nr:amidohydrolase family protein [Chelatococcus sp. SYSU_G07232]MDJ1157491.1 amidohydrolase family protein [Chelatococcus sp. SYSU_G07232]